MNRKKIYAYCKVNIKIFMATDTDRLKQILYNFANIFPERSSNHIKFVRAISKINNKEKYDSISLILEYLNLKKNEASWSMIYDNFIIDPTMKISYDQTMENSKTYCKNKEPLMINLETFDASLRNIKERINNNFKYLKLVHFIAAPTDKKYFEYYYRNEAQLSLTFKNIHRKRWYQCSAPKRRNNNVPNKDDLKRIIKKNNSFIPLGNMNKSELCKLAGFE